MKKLFFTITTILILSLCASAQEKPKAIESTKPAEPPLVVKATREQTLTVNNTQLLSQKFRADEKTAAAQAQLMEERVDALIKVIADQLHVDLTKYEATGDKQGNLQFVLKAPAATVAAPTPPPDKKKQTDHPPEK
jgi:hypothetical protein